MVKGLCMRLPVGRPLAGSRGLTISWLTAMTMMLSARPFWVTEPLMSPCLLPLSLRYALRAIVDNTLPVAAHRTDSVYAPLRAGADSPLRIERDLSAYGRRAP